MQSSIDQRFLQTTITDARAEAIVSPEFATERQPDPAYQRTTHHRNRGKALLKKMGNLKDAFIIHEIFNRPYIDS